MKYTVRPVQTTRRGWQFFRSRRVSAQMVRDVMRGRYRISVFTALLLFFSIAYIVYPSDLFPDDHLIPGWLDDLIVLFLFLNRLSAETKRYNRFKAMERKQAHS